MGETYDASVAICESIDALAGEIHLLRLLLELMVDQDLVANHTGAIQRHALRVKEVGRG